MRISETVEKKFGREFALEVIQWVAQNLMPSEVFDDKELKEWARDQLPEDIFDKKDLIEWAQNNGIAKE